MVFEGFWWFLMGFWWFLMVFDGFWWLLMVFDGFWWFLMNFDGFWWFLMVFGIFGIHLASFGMGDLPLIWHHLGQPHRATWWWMPAPTAAGAWIGSLSEPRCWCGPKPWWKPRWRSKPPDINGPWDLMGFIRIYDGIPSGKRLHFATENGPWP